MAVTFFITGTDTGVGKTVLTMQLTRRLRARGQSMRALKPFCSGGRDDALALHAAQDGELALDTINPWHFTAPLAPSIAARLARRTVTRNEVLQHLRHAARDTGVLLIEGAGGLLSPLGDDYSARDLIARLQAIPLVVCPDRLGAINQSLLVWHALPPAARRRAKLVLMGQREPDLSTRTNGATLVAALGPGRVHHLPWLADPNRPATSVRRTLDALLRPLGD